VWGPSGEAPWMHSHAQIPTALVLDDRIRIYVTVRPEQRTSLTTFVDVDIQDPQKVLYVHKEPILPLGDPGTLDEFGMMPSAALRVGMSMAAKKGTILAGETGPGVRLRSGLG